VTCVSDRPDFDGAAQIFFYLADRHLLAMENTGGQGSLRLGLRQDLTEMLAVAGAA